MKCEENKELLSLYIDHMLDDSQMKEVENHLASCAACKKEYEEMMEMVELLNRLEMVPVPDSFQFRMKKALQEEKERAAAEKAKEAGKKGKWRIITSIAAVFAVGIISFSLYHDVLGVLSDRLNGNDQAGLMMQKEEVQDGKAIGGEDSTEKIDAPAVNDTQNADLDTEENIKYGVASKGAADVYEMSNSVRGDIAKNESQESKSKEYASTSVEGAPEMMYGLADSADTGSSGDSGLTDSNLAAESADTSADTAEGSGSISPEMTMKTVPPTGCSRSLTPSGLERNAAAVQFYENLIEDKLADFDYQILSSSYVQSGEWRFRVFIFRDKDGNTYNNEICIIGKNGVIEVLDSNNFMEFQK